MSDFWAESPWREGEGPPPPKKTSTRQILDFIGFYSFFSVRKTLGGVRTRQESVSTILSRSTVGRKEGTENEDPPTSDFRRRLAMARQVGAASDDDLAEVA